MRGEFDRLTVLENLLVAAPGQLGEKARWLALPGRKWRHQQSELVEKARGLLQRFELTEREDAYATELSGGQRRLMELARALMADPSALLLDEPMAGVNPTLSRQLGAHLLDLARSGLAIILVEHELGLIEQVCDHVVAMAQGRVIAEGSMASLREHAEVVDAYIVG
jgi:ABC-type branched-subunit amino acid transport system ATPase component